MPLTDMLNQAIQHHQNGQLDQAEALYRQALEDNPNHAGIHHCLGMIGSQTDRSAMAIEHVTKALEISPEVARFQNTLGVVLEEAGREQDAVKAYEQAISLDPTFAEAYNNLAIVWQNLAQYDKAIDASQQALTWLPRQGSFHNTLACSLQQNGQSESALQSFRDAVKYQPNNPEPLNHMGVIYTDLEQYDQAISCLKKAIALATDYAEAHNHLGMAYHGAGRLDDAIAAFQQALALEPDFIQSRYNLGNAQLAQGHCDQAIVTFNECLAQDPDYALAHWNLSHALLLKGEYCEGWTHYAWRRHADLDIELYPYPLKGPAWDGQPFPNQRLLVHFEQGHGDSIQLARFLTRAKALGGEVIVQVRESMARVFETIDGIDELITINETGIVEDIKYDFHASLFDLPGLFNVTLDTLTDTPYVTCVRDLEKSWQPRITSKHFKVGLVWAGSQIHGNDKNRSCDLSQWAPLMDLPGITWYSLQKGPAAEQLSQSPFSQQITDLNDSIADFGGTCGAIEHMDLVISVDTSVLHLAGAMGKPTWALLPHAPDWRWLQNRSDSPWYKSVTLFRQNRPGHWEGVMQDVAARLARLTSLEPAMAQTPPTRTAVPVIIPAFKNKTQLNACVQHLECQTAPCDIFIRDNSEDNIFFTAAVNEGIKHFLNTDCPYMLALNQDMYLKPNAVEEMVAFMEAHPKCGIGAPLQLDHNKPDHVIWGGSLYAFPAGRHHMGPVSQYSQPRQVLWANGACMILRKDMIQDIGLLDKNLAFIGSDSDYSFTARARGWEVWCITTAQGCHEHGASGGATDPFLQNLKIKDMLYFGEKWLTGGLYRALAFEILEPKAVEDIMAQMRNALA
ncbi:MAG: tetratricopeptide repeat protein [Phycisphaeraceae bacterium]|nr:tetratricopeptide repeat protein [Phycisphaeraceae bacterium]